ncbi:transcriptional repressor LexA [Candidatus Gracilibacteria bacterium]|nr:transcriptional repressor LexA [Candidatus Gracilibacteria bacterium]
MNTDKKYGEKIGIITDYIKNGGVINSLGQIAGLLGYANRSGARKFLEKLVKNGLFEVRNRKYYPTSLISGLPFFEFVSAGLPFTPEGNEVNSNIEIDKFLVEHPSSTFLVKVKGDSMKDAGIMEGDIVVVDKSRNVKNGDIIIASFEGDVTIKYYKKEKGVVFLIPANVNFKPIVINTNAEILGVVVGTIRKYN